MRWVFRFIGLLVVLIVIAVGALFLLPADRIARIAEDKFESTTGRALTISGDVRPSIWPNIGVQTGALRIANADWSDKGPMLEADGLSVAVELMPLIRGDVRIKGVQLDTPRILLEAGRDGRANWDFAAEGSGSDAAGQSGTGSGPRAFSLDRAVVSNGSLTFIGADGTSTDLRSMDATVEIPEFAGDATVDLSARLNGAPVSLSSTVSGFASFLDGGAVPVELAAQAGGSKIEFNGRAGISPLAAAGTMDGNLDDLAGLMAALGQPVPKLSDGLGRDKLRVASNVTFTDSTLNLRDLAVTLDQNAITGAADVTFGGARPRIKANLSLGDFDLSAAETGGGAKRDAGGETTGWSNDPIDVSALSLLDAELALSATSLALGTTRLNRTSLLVTLEDSRAVTEIRELTAYDGGVAGSVVVNGRGGLSSRVNLSGSAIAISRLLNELVGYDRLIAAGDVSLSVLGSGNSMDALMNSLNGEGSFDIGAGELLGFDLIGMLKNLDTSFIGEGTRTIFDRITGRFRVVDGVMIYDDLSMAAPLFSATGGGKIGLGGRTLDLRIVPELLGGDGQGIRVPLLISGTWAKPKFRLDLEALAKENLGEQVEEAVQQVESAAKAAVAEQLGVDPEADLEDTARDKLEEELRDGLLDLFGNN
ncbi:MAG: AsmA family protein [Rhodobacteraceae bacterium]|nr:AsmA family protein [Paracoccaceae bacterium]